MGKKRRSVRGADGRPDAFVLHSDRRRWIRNFLPSARGAGFTRKEYMYLSVFRVIG
jgi:hypothetical protein